MSLLILDLLSSSLFQDLDFASITISGRKCAKQDMSKTKLDTNIINVVKGKFLPFAFFVTNFLLREKLVMLYF